MKLVLGYVRGVDRLPREARRLGLVRRSALVLASHRLGSPDALLDAVLYAAVVEAVGRAQGATARVARLDEGGALDVSKPGAVLAALKAIPEVKREPFPKIEFANGALVVSLAFYEPYVNVGGPDPYHDSYTIAVYTAAVQSKEIEAEVALVAKMHAGGPLEVIRGASSPEDVGLVDALATRLAHLLGLWTSWWSKKRRPGG